jgi:hypothetical protein
MEYGLAIMPRDQKLRSLWDRAQNAILRVMLSVCINTKAAQIRVIYHLQFARTRHDELSCRWMCAMALKTGDTILVDHALRESREYAIEGSYFKFVFSRYNNLMQKVRRTPFFGGPTWKQNYHPFLEDNICDGY